MCIDTRRTIRGVEPARSGNYQRGVTLIELVVFIIIVSVGVVGLISVTGSLTRYSPDPMIRKQMIAIAESLLNEVLHQPFTYCDPDDANAATAMDYVAGVWSGTQVCAGAAGFTQNKGAASSVVALTSSTSHAAGFVETRYSSGIGTQFDNVADYGGFSSAAIDDVTGGNAMIGYGASVAIVRDGATFSVASDAVLRVTVTVTHAGLDSFSLTGYRFRYAPRN